MMVSVQQKPKRHQEVCGHAQRVDEFVYSTPAMSLIEP
jgi:hypothetical protein